MIHFALLRLYINHIVIEDSVKNIQRRLFKFKGIKAGVNKKSRVVNAAECVFFYVTDVATAISRAFNTLVSSNGFVT